MSETKLTRLSHLRMLATRNKAELDAINTKIQEIVTAGGEPNKLEGVKVNGTALAIAGKMVDLLIASGSENGTISVNNVDVAVTGLKALAYKAEVSEAELAAALAEKINAKAENADLEALAGRVGANETAIGTLNADAETAGSVDYKIAQAVAAIMENPDETMNSIQELVNWTNDHAADALELSNQVTKNKNDIASLVSLVGTLPEGATSTTVVGYIAEAIAAIGIGDYAKTTEVTAAINTALENYYTKSEVYTKAEIEAMIATDDAVNAMITEVFSA